jgi:hypothetical protein
MTPRGGQLFHNRTNTLFFPGCESFMYFSGDTRACSFRTELYAALRDAACCMNENASIQWFKILPSATPTK